MESWILLAVAAQVITAGVAIVDKYIVTSEKVMPRPFVYAFYTCILSGAWVAVFTLGLLPVPFFASLGVPSFGNVEAPTLHIAALSILAAYTFFVGLVSLYTAFKEADASDVVPVVGSVSAIASFALSYFLLDARLTPNFLAGLILLAFGTFLVSHLRFSLRVALSSIHAGFFFALHYVTLKGLFNETSFDNGFFWSRISFIIVALSMLLVPAYYAKITEQTKATTRKSGALVLANKLMAGIGSIMILKATAGGDVAVVQALGGLQFVFILLFTMFFGHRTSVDCGENITCNQDIYHKAIFVAIISVGFFVLFI
jgi:drug/metabolite transporter (DMT)-like permease